MKRFFQMGSKGKTKEKGKGEGQEKEKAKSTNSLPLQSSSHMVDGEDQSVKTSFSLSSHDLGERSESRFSLPISLVESEPLPDLEKYQFLHALKTVFVVENSLSMNSIWEDVSETIQKIIPICAQHDEDGIDVALPNTRGRFQHIITAQAVKNIFRKTEIAEPNPIGASLRFVLRTYLQDLGQPEIEDKRPLSVVVIMTSLPTDESQYFKLENVVELTALRLQETNLPASQVSIHFFQVGDNAETADMLEKLDKNCKDGTFVRDIVDVHTFRTYGGDITREAVFEAIQTRVDGAEKGRDKS